MSRILRGVDCRFSVHAYNSLMAKKITLNELGDMLAHVVKHMATKDDIADLKLELKGDIARVQEQVNSMYGGPSWTTIPTMMALSSMR